MKPPAVERAVQTTPPITSAATIPAVPLSPTATMMNEAMMSVMSVMPETGLEPTIAIAFAATVVKRKAIIITIASPTIACVRLWTTPNWKNTKTRTVRARIPKTMIFIEISFCVRSISAFLPLPLPPSSLTARPKA